MSFYIYMATFMIFIFTSQCPSHRKYDLISRSILSSRLYIEKNFFFFVYVELSFSPCMSCYLCRPFAFFHQLTDFLSTFALSLTTMKKLGCRRHLKLSPRKRNFEQWGGGGPLSFSLTSPCLLCCLLRTLAALPS